MRVKIPEDLVLKIIDADNDYQLKSFLEDAGDGPFSEQWPFGADHWDEAALIAADTLHQVRELVALEKGRKK